MSKDWKLIHFVAALRAFVASRFSYGQQDNHSISSEQGSSTNSSNPSQSNAISLAPQPKPDPYIPLFYLIQNIHIITSTDVMRQIFFLPFASAPLNIVATRCEDFVVLVALPSTSVVIKAARILEKYQAHKSKQEQRRQEILAKRKADYEKLLAEQEDLRKVVEENKNAIMGDRKKKRTEAQRRIMDIEDIILKE